MKTTIDKSNVEFEFIRYVLCFTNEFDELIENDIEIMCDYVDVLRHEIANVNNTYFDALRREQTIVNNDNERVFVAIECETQNEFIVIYNVENKYVSNAYRV